MKLSYKPVVKYLLLFLIISLPCYKLTAQQFLTSIDGWNAYVHLPDDYNVTGSQQYPTIIFFPGLGEVGSNPGAVIYYGPGSFIANGWNGNVVVNGVTVKPIIISLQPPGAFPQPSAIETRIQTIKSLYRVDPNRLHLTGLSHGGWCTSMYVMANSTQASNVASIVAIQAMRPDDNPLYPVPFTTYAALGGHWLGYEQSADFRDMATIANTMNSVTPGSALYIQTNIAGGGHCCWNYWYDPNHTDNYVLNGVSGNWSIYQYMLTWAHTSGPPAPLAPIANAGSDITINLPTTSVVLNGSGTDPDGSIASYSWTQISGPSQYNIVTPGAAQTTVDNLVQGVYWFQLLVTDNSGATATDVVVVTVNATPPPPANISPVANAGNDITLNLPTNSTVLNGSGTDADGTIASYNWTKIAGPAQFNIATPAAAQTTIDNLVQGVYWFQLQVTDNNGATGNDVIIVTVNAAPPPPTNISPVANAGTDITITLPTNSVSLNGNGTDADGTITGYSWTKISGPSQFNIATPAAAQTTIDNLVQGIYWFQLQVTDNNGATGNDVIIVTVNAAPPPPTNISPVANAGTDITITLPANSVSLNGSGTDADGTISGYTWTQIFGPSPASLVSPSSAQTSVNNLMQGIYWFQLQVTDNNGATAVDVMVVTVNPAPIPNIAPSAYAGNDINITLPLNSVTLNGSGTDADGSIVGYSWTKISGPAQYNIVSPSIAQTTVNNLVQGVYWFQIQITDNNGATAIDVVAVTVNVAPPSNMPPVANAGSDVNISLPVNSVVLNGSATDADGTITGYTWKKISGPLSYNILTANAAISTVNNLVQGIYQFELAVTDNSGDIARDTVAVTVNIAGAGNCGCDVLLQPAGDGSIYLNMAGYNLQPGAKVCIQAGNYTNISLEHIKGTAAQPITIINCGGPVITGSGGNYGIRIIRGQYFRLTGTGDGSQQYGFKVLGPPTYLSAGLAIADSSTDFEIDHIEVSKANVGFFVKTQPQNCNPGSWGDNDNNTMRNVSLHDNYIHNTRGEGFYIGSTFYTMQVIDCNGNTITVEAQKIRGLKIYNNITDTTEWDGIQVSNAPDNVEIYNNVVKNYGTINMGSQQAGIIMGGKCNGKVYNNYIQNGTGNGLQIMGYGDISIYNNIIVNAGFDGSGLGQDAMIIDDRPTPGFAGPRVFVMNNTIVNPARNGILLQNSYGTFVPGSLFYNNLVVKPGAASIVFAPSIADSSNNIFKPQIVDAGFVNPSANNYHLAAGSVAIDAGRDATSYGIARDYDGNLRPYGVAFDAGAYEVVSGAPPANLAPVADAGNDITITLPVNSTTLTGSGTDADGTITGYTWTKIFGPAQFNIVSPSTAQTTVNNLVQGIYWFQLQVTDNTGATAVDVVIVNVNAAPPPPPPPPVNQPPVANAGTNISITLPTNLVTLNGTGTDADGTIVSYAWTKILGPAQFNIVNPSSAQTVVNGLVEGIYQFQIRVTDNNGATDVDSVLVTVFAAPPPPPVNQPPVANAGTNISITLPVNVAALNGSGTDTDGTIVSYAWTRISGPTQFNIVNPGTAQTNVDNLVQGVYQFQLLVTDNGGATDAATVTVTVLPAGAPNQPPVANAGVDQGISLPINSVVLNGNGTDGDGSIVSYNWRKISGPVNFTIISPAQSQTIVSDLIQGTYFFELTVTDNDGATGKDTVGIYVVAPANRRPTANAGDNKELILPQNSVLLNGNGNDPDGIITDFNWREISGPGRYRLMNPGSAQTMLDDLVEGTYAFEFEVTDNNGATATDTLEIMVKNIPESKVIIYPNPVKSIMNIQIDANTHTSFTFISIYDVNGKVVHRESFMRNQSSLIKQIDVSHLPNGPYFVEVTADINRKVTTKVIKE